MDLHKPKIVAVGEAVLPTGFARVFQSIFIHLQKTFDITHFGINYRGEPLDWGWRIEPNRVIGDGLGVRQLPQIIETIKPDIIFFMS